MSLSNRPYIILGVLFCLSLALNLFGILPALADETDIHTLDPLIVTGSAHPTRLSRSTQSHTIIDHQNFYPTQPNRLGNILQNVPGMHLDEMGSRGGISSIYLRGADPNFTLIMLDGIPLNDATDQRGGSVDLSTIPIDQITRIEMVRGPLSALYGSEAMAGAINLITHRPSQDASVRVLTEGGRFDSRKGLIQGQRSLGSLSANLSLSHSRNEEQVEADSFSHYALGWNIGLDPQSQWDVRMTGSYTQSLVNSFPEGSGGPRFALLRETEQRQTRALVTGLTATLEDSTEWHHQLFLSLSTRSQDVDNPGVLSAPSLFAIPPTRFSTDYQRYQGRLTETWTVTSNLRFSFGGQITHELGKRDGIQDLSTFGGRADEPVDFSLDRTFGGSFVEITAAPITTFTLNAGARIDLSQQSHPRLSPRISARYHLLPFLHLRGAYGKGFKLPGLASLGDPLIGNPALQPETSTGWDLGIVYHTPHKEFTASITYFHNRFHGLIDLDPDLLTQNRFQLTNLGTAVTKGMEFSFQLSPQAPVSFQANLTSLTTRVTETGDPLRNRPKWRGGLGLTVELLPSVRLNGRVTVVSSRLDLQIPTQTTRVGGYTKADVTLTYQPAQAWSWYAALENLTNASYEEFQGFPGPPLTFRLGIDYFYSTAGYPTL